MSANDRFCCKSRARMAAAQPRRRCRPLFLRRRWIRPSDELRKDGTFGGALTRETTGWVLSCGCAGKAGRSRALGEVEGYSGAISRLKLERFAMTKVLVTLFASSALCASLPLRAQAELDVVSLKSAIADAKLSWPTAAATTFTWRAGWGRPRRWLA